MDEHKSLSDSIYEEQTYLAERELSSFIAAVTELYGQCLRTDIGGQSQSQLRYELLAD
jgi:hypothetical protein